MSALPTQRRADVDWIRVGAFGLLIIYHVGLFYAPWDWHVHSDHIVQPLKSAVLITNPWRLTLLFLVSGVALGFMCRNRDPAAVMRARLNRLLLPLLFGVVLIVPPQAWIECLDKGTWDKGYIEFWLAQFRPERWGNAFPLNHLWFVLYIGIYSVIALAIFTSPQRRLALADWLEKSLSGWRLLVLPILYLAFARQMLIGWFGLTNHFPTDWYNHSVSFVVFACGFLLATREGVWQNFERLRWHFLALAVLALPLLIINDAHPGGRAFFSTIRNSLMGIDAWSTIGAILGFGSKHLRKADGPVLRYLTDAVFPCYLVHQTILVTAAFALKHSGLPLGIEAGLLVLVTLCGSLAIYEIVRRIEPIRPLFGLKPRVTRTPQAAPATELNGPLSAAALD
ncbi:MAG: acyltransferase family protein, partial [Caulobacterales bacterium]